MSKKTKIWLLCAAACFVLGALIFTVTLAVGGWDIMKLNQTKISRVTHEITQEVHSIEIDVKTADVVLIRSSDGASRAVCDEQEKVPYQVSVEDGTLKIISYSGNEKEFEIPSELQMVRLHFIFLIWLSESYAISYRGALPKHYG